jgi:outer membrane protein OmpA-like peptidoglycan-associated protein
MSDSPPSRGSGSDVDGQTPNGERLASLLIGIARYVDPVTAPSLPAPSGDPSLDALRHILLDRELQVLARLRRTLDDPERLAATVSEVLSLAVQRAAGRDGRLGEVLAPAVERAAQCSVNKDPRTFIGIFSPLMGATIRKSIAETLESTLQSLNQALKHSLSWRGLLWRIEARRAGTTFADVVLRHTLVYRVEHLFLIHKESGLLISHVAADDAATEDPQLVSGMLTAIQDFVRDSFGRAEATGLDTLRLGDQVLWCEQGALAFLAAVIRGTPPESLHGTFRDALAAIHDEWRTPLAEFAGDDASFGGVPDRLRTCLQAQARTSEKRLSPLLWALPLLLIVLGGYWLYERHEAWQRFDRYVARLEAEPGIVVTSAGKRDGVWQVTGMRDPLSPDPTTLLAAAQLAPAEVEGHWQPYLALDPALALKRYQTSLSPPPSVSLKLDDGTVRALGSAPHHWIERARALVRTLPPGSPGLDLTSLEDPEMAEYERVRSAVQSHVIYFAHNVPKPANGQEPEMDALASDLLELERVAREMRVTARVTITGHADSTGKDTPNLALSTGRAEVVRSMLKARGVDPDLLAVRGAGPLEPLKRETTDEDRSINRRVSFTVGIGE